MKKLNKDRVIEILIRVFLGVAIALVAYIFGSNNVHDEYRNKTCYEITKDGTYKKVETKP